MSYNTAKLSQLRIKRFELDIEINQEIERLNMALLQKSIRANSGPLSQVSIPPHMLLGVSDQAYLSCSHCCTNECPAKPPDTGLESNQQQEQ